MACKREREGWRGRRSWKSGGCSQATAEKDGVRPEHCYRVTSISAGEAPERSMLRGEQTPMGLVLAQGERRRPGAQAHR